MRGCGVTDHLTGRLPAKTPSLPLVSICKLYASLGNSNALGDRGSGAQSSLGNYDAAARYYTRALGLNPSAASVWGYLRSSLTCGDRTDLLAAVADSDLEALQRALPL